MIQQRNPAQLSKLVLPFPFFPPKISPSLYFLFCLHRQSFLAVTCVKPMLKASTLPESPVENPEGCAAAVPDGSKAEHGEDADRNLVSNRWPREETMALLKIRSNMDVTFRDTNPKAPLWEQVSRKLAELGYDRSAKKCKEKFENIYKYYRRTKEGRCGKSNGNKTYRFFEQLEALNGHHSLPPPSITAPSTHVPDNNVDVIIRDAVPCSVHMGEHEHEHELSGSSISGSGKGFKKRKLTQFLEGMMNEVIKKQETMQRKLMEVLEKSERDQMVREEAWKKEELTRIKRERELLAQERSIIAAKDEALIAFLKKFAEAEDAVQLLKKIQVQTNKDKDLQLKLQNNSASANVDSDMEKDECRNENVVSLGNFVHMSSSRWPKDEVEALIRLRTELDVQSQNGSKGPLWEEISLAMKGLGYDRSAKRCKEKWENINKYFKRMKEKNKRKPMDSKTCPYYHHLEALYSKKPKKLDEFGGNNNSSELKPEELLMHIMESQDRREQQHMESQSSSEDAEKENTDQNHGDNEDQSGAYQNQMVDNSPSIAITS